MIIPTVQVGSSKCWFSRVPVHPGSRVHPVHPEVVASVRLCEEGTFFFCQDHRYVEIYDICYPQKMLDSSKIAIFTDFAVGHFLSLPTKWLDIRRVNLGHTPCSNMGRSQLVSLFIKSRHLYLFVSFCHHFQSGLGSIYFHQAKGIHVLREKKGSPRDLGHLPLIFGHVFSRRP